MKKQRRLISYLLLAITTVTWGLALVIVKPALNVTTAYRFLFYRFLLASMGAMPILIHYRKFFSLKHLKDFVTITKIELIGTTAALALLYTGLKYTTALEANLINTTQPIFITLGGIWLLKEKEEGHEWLGMVLAFLATIGLVFIPVLQQGMYPLFHGALLGNLLVLAMVITNLFYFPLAKRNYHYLPKFFVVAISFVVGLISFFILSWLEAGSWSALIQAIASDVQAQSVWVASGYMALFGSLIGLTCYLKGQDGIEASEAGLFAYLQPFIYIPAAMLLLGESLSILQALLLLLVLIGVVIAERRVKVHSRSRAHQRITSRSRS